MQMSSEIRICGCGMLDIYLFYDMGEKRTVHAMIFSAIILIGWLDSFVWILRTVFGWTKIADLLLSKL